MTPTGYDDDKLNELRSKINSYKKQLAGIEEKINSIKSFWFLE